MKILDLFCGGGGMAYGYSLVGFEVVGVDLQPQPSFPFEFVQADALDYLEKNSHRFDLISASPPCQAYSLACRVWKDKDYPDLIAATRDLLKQSDKPYVIENVPNSPLINPVQLCGTAFGLMSKRHRLFETNFKVHPVKCRHDFPTVELGHRPKRWQEYIEPVGHFSDVEYARLATGLFWMKQKELAQAIPPLFSAYIGSQFLSNKKAP